MIREKSEDSEKKILVGMPKWMLNLMFHLATLITSSYKSISRPISQLLVLSFGLKIYL